MYIHNKTPSIIICMVCICYLINYATSLHFFCVWCGSTTNPYSTATATTTTDAVI